MGILSNFTKPPKPQPPGYRYRFVVILLCLLAFTLMTGIGRPEYTIFILAFLFYFLSNQFAWPTRVMVILRVLALIGLVIALFNLFYTMIY
jgi:hypothetical protein